MTAFFPPFRLAHPTSVQEAIAAGQANRGSRFVAGGTDLVANMRRGLARPPLLIDLSRIDEMAGVALIEGRLRIGAAATIAALACNPEIGERYGALSEAAKSIAGPGHRAMATVGGNLCLDTRCLFYNQSEWWRRANGYCLKHGGDTCHVAPQGRRCHAAFSGDLAPALMALGAEVEIAGPRDRRRVPLAALYIEDGREHLDLRSDELVVAVHLPSDPPPSAYGKARVRGAIDYPLAGVAVALDMAGANVRQLRVGLTGTNSRPFLLAGTDSLAGRPADERMQRDIERLVQKQVQPMRTTMVSAHYRRLAAASLACRLVARLAGDGVRHSGSDTIQ